jgi:hypothetical protein
MDKVEVADRLVKIAKELVAGNVEKTHTGNVVMLVYKINGVRWKSSELMSELKKATQQTKKEEALLKKNGLGIAQKTDQEVIIERSGILTINDSFNLNVADVEDYKDILKKLKYKNLSF